MVAATAGPSVVGPAGRWVARKVVEMACWTVRMMGSHEVVKTVVYLAPHEDCMLVKRWDSKWADTKVVSKENDMVDEMVVLSVCAMAEQTDS